MKQFYMCPYCWKRLPNNQTGCCGEVGHGINSRDTSYHEDDMSYDNWYKHEYPDWTEADYADALNPNEGSK